MGDIGMTYVDKYTIQTIGSKWNKGKEKKHQILTEITSDMGVDIKKLCRFLEEYEDNLVHGYTNCKVQIIFEETK